MKTRIYLLMLLALGLLTFSCVPARQFQDEKAKREKCETENKAMKVDYDQVVAANKDLEGQTDGMKKQIRILEQDTLTSGIALRKLVFEYDKLNTLYELLNQKNKELLAMNASETQKINTELQLTKEMLDRKEAELKKLENELNLKKQNLDQMQSELMIKEKRIMELESMLSRKDSAVQALKAKISQALVGFENNGLTVVSKNGKVYVSMDESLLFASGSWTVGSKGKDALVKLAKVLENNTNINIMVEGHTDNVAYNGSGQVKDNWDLSVMRATAVTKILLQNSNIDPSRIIAAGRSQYIPVDAGNTSSARQKNRRTEIILSPKLDDLLKILESN